MQPSDPLPMRSVLLAAAFAAAAASASSIPASKLFERQSTCAEGFNQCASAGLPRNFCCPSGHQCLALAANTTTVCCPPGADCARIEPITCDLTLQNPDAHPNSVVQTSVLDGIMATCGEACCPFGYSCGAGNICTKDANQRNPPKRSATSTTPTQSSTSTSSSSTSTATDGAASNPAAAPAESQQGGSNTGAVVGGVIGGLIAIIIIGVAVFLFMRRRKRMAAQGDGPAGGDRSSIRNMISNPIVNQGQTAMRADFARKPSSGTAASAPGSALNSNYAGAGRLGSPASQNSNVSEFGAGAVSGYDPTAGSPLPAIPRHAQISPIRNMRVDSRQIFAGGYGGFGNGSPPQTPPQQRSLTPDSERERQSRFGSISIFADPQTVGSDRRNTNETSFNFNTSDRGRRDSNVTQIGHMMAQAGLGLNDPFVPPSSTMPDNRPRRPAR